MYFASELQIAVKLNKFRNIQIKSPCQFLVRITIDHFDDLQGKISGIPISIINNSNKVKIPGLKNESQINQNSYWSKSFKIKHQQQVVVLEQICIFKTKFNAYSTTKKFKLNLLFQLIACKEDNYVTMAIYKNQLQYTGKVATFMPIYFNQYGYISGIDAQLYIKMISYKFIDNRIVIKQLKQLNNNSPKVQLQEFSDFKSFLSYVTKKFQSNLINKFYDTYIGQLKYEILTIKQQIRLFLDFLQKRQQNSQIRGKLLKKINFPFPKSNFQLKYKNKTNLKTQNQKQIPQILQQLILSQLNQLSGLIYQLWSQFINLLNIYPNSPYSKQKQQNYLNILKQYFLKKNAIIQNFPITHQTPNIFFYQNHNNQTTFKLSKQYLYLTKDYNVKRHILIFVHGYQAYGLDMQAIKNYIFYLYPNLQILISTVNEGKTENNLQDQGQKFALQVKNYLNGINSFEKVHISFICHSMGGLIARAALPYLSFFKRSFKYFITLASPHFGYLYHSSTLIKTSLWVLNKMNKTPSMMQLCFQDNIQLQECYIFKLSKTQGLEWFKSIILVGSKSDEYVPYHSARIEIPDEYLNNNSKQARIYKIMLENILQKIDKKSIIRMQALFEQKQKNFNSMIGRTAHIKILSDIKSIKLFVALLHDIFI